MGMFDEIRVEVPLPGGYQPPDGVFQTKDLENRLETYVITSEGRLMMTDAQEHLKPQEALPLDLEFHGVLHFHDYLSTPLPGFPVGYYEWRAKFTDGTLVNIELVDRPQVKESQDVTT